MITYWKFSIILAKLRNIFIKKVKNWYAILLIEKFN